MSGPVSWPGVFSDRVHKSEPGARVPKRRGPKPGHGGRPPKAPEDRRRPRGGFSDREWSEVQEQAEAANMTAAAWVRSRCGL